MSDSLLSNVRQRLAARQPYLEQAALAERGLLDPRWEVRAAATRGLGSLGSHAALREALRDGHPLVRAAAVCELGKLGAFKEVTLAFQDEDWQVREMVALTLRAAFPDRAHPVLQAALHDASSAVRSAAIAPAPQTATMPELATGWRRWMGTAAHCWWVGAAQARIIHPGIWWVLAGIMTATTCFLSFSALRTPGFIPAAGMILAIVTLLCAGSCVAFLADARHDSSLEVVLATRTPAGAILLSRGAIVVGYLVVLACGASGVTALASGASAAALIQLWAPPLLALAAMTLALAAFAGSSLALVGALIGVALQACQIRLTHGVAIVFGARFWQFSPLMLVLSVSLLVFAAWYASRHPRLAAEGL